MQFIERLRQPHLLFDGAMGTLLMKAGLSAGASPDVWCLTHPDEVRAIHAAYLSAGADVVLTNTLGANAVRQKRSKLDPAALAAAGVRIAREAVAACGREAYVALDVGSLGEFLEPMGDLTEEEAVEFFRAPIEAGAAAGADCILIETMYDLNEALCAVRAAKTYGGGLPVLCTLSYGESGRLMTGTTIEQAAAALEAAGADAHGANCGVGPEQLVHLLPRFLSSAHVPLLLKPNAGLPEMDGERTVYRVGPEAFAEKMKLLWGGGVWGVGGCCGTTPEHIRALVTAVSAR